MQNHFSGRANVEIEVKHSGNLGLSITPSVDNYNTEDSTKI